MKITLDFIQLSEPLFLGGVNFGNKVYTTSKGGVTMWYDTDLEHTIVVYKNHVAMIEQTASKTLYDPSEIGISIPKIQKPIMNNVSHPQTSGLAVRAQASGPNREEMMRPVQMSAQVSTPTTEEPKKPGRRPKYQGQESPEG